MQVSRKNIVIIIFLLTVVGLIWSRALLSISAGLWFVVALVCLYKKQLNFKHEPLWIWSLSALALWLPGLWQAPFANTNYDLLLSWLAYPAIALGAIVIHAVGVASVCRKIWIYGAAIAALYPILWLLLHITNALTLIKTGKAIPVFMDNDHLRFSIYLASALLLSFSLENKKIKRILILFFLTAILLLSVRTGIILAAIIFISHWSVVIGQWWNRRNVALRQAQGDKRSTVYRLSSTFYRPSSIIYCLVLLFCLPLLYQKLNYTLYDYQQFNTKGYDANYSDGVRRAINKASIKAIENNFIGGVGWNNIKPTIQQYFYQQYLQAPPFSWPFSQYLFWLLGAGIIGLLSSTAWLLFPIWPGWLIKQKEWMIWSIAIAVSCLVESNLSYQFGITLHAWPLWLATINNQRSNV
ncbi:MAG: O-antigen ligase family protein [Chitinophagaceae bacterium]|nr:O-antigen ligase family protein [Chitinophagaceae bacterium]